MINNVVLVGRLTRDPELRYLPNATATCTFTLAIDRPFKNGNGEREADFIQIVTWKQLAETCAQYLKKGRLTGIEGRIQVRHYDKDGSRVYITEVVANNVRFLESAREPQRETVPPSEPYRNEKGEVDIPDSDLPF